MLILYKFITFFRSISVKKKRLIKILIDFLLINISVIFSSWIIPEYIYQINYLLFISITSYLFIGIPLFIITGQYNELTSYISSFSLYLIAIRNFIFVVIFGIVTNLFIGGGIFKFSIIFWFLISSMQLLVRIFIRDIILNVERINKTNIKNVAIYGAGSAGAQLNISLFLSGNYNVKFFIDDNKRISGMSIGGVKVLSPERAMNHMANIDKVFLAIPSLRPKRKKEIINFLLDFNLPVMEVPSVNEIISGEKSISSMRSIDINDLLYRNIAITSKDIQNSCIRESVILVTGAAGSIGSEISRQILNLKPRKVILLDHSESDLYKINLELEKIFIEQKIKSEFILGSVVDKFFMRELIKIQSINIIFHCAAYKHVPILEANPLVGIYNNVFSTKIICECSELPSINKIILISTDKAVRPTNVMGASKRLAELIIQAYDDREKIISNTQLINNPKTFSIVRFGNVLGSSGSVVPLFKSQIEKGGPITLTHPEIVRYFMTISEAAQLVLQAATLSDGGDLFILDMGKAILIKDLAKKMIALSGLTLKNKDNPDGDIQIIITGLRPGEKIREELLIDGKSIPTSHPLIYKAIESFIKFDELSPKLDVLESELKNNNKKKVFSKLKELVPEWKINKD